jgi:hypothetical protein
MTKDMLACVDRSKAAERSGEAAEALEWHQAVPMFGRGRHRALLDRLARLGPDVPAWVWVRWAIYQAIRCEDRGSETADSHRVTLRFVAENFHADLLSDCYQDNGDPVKVSARVLGESWAFHQLFAHEAGGLRSFLAEFAASGPLADHSALAACWTEAPMGGWRLDPRGRGGLLRIEDASSGKGLEILDLGARAGDTGEGWVLGRLVPSGVDGLLMLDCPPLAVSERLAREVASAAHFERWAVIHTAVMEGRLTPDALLREDYELATDVQELDLLRFGTARRDLDRVMGQLWEGRDEVGRAAYRILRRALDGDVDEGDAAYVAAAALNPHAQDEAPRRLLRPGQYDVWARWAALVPEPGRGRLMEIARSSQAAA